MSANCKGDFGGAFLLCGATRVAVAPPGNRLPAGPAPVTAPPGEGRAAPRRPRAQLGGHRRGGDHARASSGALLGTGRRAARAAARATNKGCRKATPRRPPQGSATGAVSGRTRTRAKPAQRDPQAGRSPPAGAPRLRRCGLPSEPAPAASELKLAQQKSRRDDLCDDCSVRHGMQQRQCTSNHRTGYGQSNALSATPKIYSCDGGEA